MPIYKQEGKKNGLQRYMVQVSKVVDGQLKRITRAAYGKSAALETEKKLERELSTLGTEEATGNMTVGELYEEHQAATAGSVKASTLRFRERFWKHHIAPVFADVRLGKLSTRRLARWKLGVESKGLKLSTKRHIYAVLSGMLNYAVRMGYLSSNPLMRVGNFREALQPATEMDYYTLDEFRQFIAAAEADARERAQGGDMSGWDYYVFFNLAFWTGMRKGEIHALTWGTSGAASFRSPKASTKKAGAVTRCPVPRTPRQSARSRCRII